MMNCERLGYGLKRIWEVRKNLYSSSYKTTSWTRQARATTPNVRRDSTTMVKASRDRRCEIELVAHCNSLTILSVDDEEGNAGDRKTNDVEDDQEYEEMKTSFEKFWQSTSAQKYPLRARDIILKSCCQRVFGMAGAKLAMVLALVGGVAREDVKTKTKVRGEVHLLYVGDPGIGKSQL